MAEWAQVDKKKSQQKQATQIVSSQPEQNPEHRNPNTETRTQNPEQNPEQKPYQGHIKIRKSQKERQKREAEFSRDRSSLDLFPP